MAYNVKFLKGTQEKYNASDKNAYTFYYVEDSQDLYLGSVKLSNAAEIAAAVDSIGVNASDISNIKAALGQLTESKFNALSGEFETAKSDISTLKTDVSGLKTSVDNHGTRLGQVETKATNNASAIQGIQGDLADLQGIVATDAALQAEITRATAEEARIAGLVAAEQARAEGVEAGHKARIETMEAFWAAAEADGTDKNVIDTLKEIQEYIISDTSGAASMAASIQANAQAITDMDTAYKAADTAINGEINGVKGRVSTVEGHTADLNSRMPVVEKAATDNATNIGKNADAIGKNTEDIAKNATAIGANADAIAAEKERAMGVESGHETRIKSLEEMTTGGTGSIAQQIKTAKEEAVAAAKTETTSQVDAAKATLQSTITAAKEEAILTAASDAASKYATLAQGAKADSALQAENITTGTTNGSIKVKGTDIEVAGLKSAAFKEASEFEVAGAAQAAQTAAKEYTDTAEANAKEYTDTAEANAKEYTDTAEANAKAYTDTAEANAKAYTDTALTWGTIV